MLNKINSLKSILNKELKSKKLSNKDIIKISQQLDGLILEHYYSKDKKKNDESNSEDIGK